MTDDVTAVAGSARWAWLRQDPGDHAPASDRRPCVLAAGVFDRLAGGAPRPGDRGEGLYAARYYGGESEALADLPPGATSFSGGPAAPVRVVETGGGRDRR